MASILPQPEGMPMTYAIAGIFAVLLFFLLYEAICDQSSRRGRRASRQSSVRAAEDLSRSAASNAPPVRNFAKPRNKNVA